MEEYRTSAYAYARAASDFIDGDKIAGYVETGETDLHYDIIQRYFDNSLREAGMKYFYVFVPYEEELVYVWDGLNTEDDDLLGEHENYFGAYDRNAVMEEFVKDPPMHLYETNTELYGHIATAYYPVFNSAGDPVALVGVDYEVSGINRTVNSFIEIIIVCVLVVTLIVGTIFYFYLRKGMIEPLYALNNAAKDMVDGLEEGKQFKLNIQTDDEVEELAGSFETMYTDLQDYIHQLSTVTAERERIGAELNVATKIQRDMLPDKFPAFPDHKEFDVFALMHPAKEVGGDFFDFFLIDDTHLALVIADVSGKGVPAALFMVISKTLIKNRALMGGGPAEILGSVNQQLAEGNETGMFVTVWLGIIDITTGKGLFANAGHEHPVLRRKGEDYELLNYPHSLFVGGMEGVTYREHEFQMNPGDRLFVYTDGVPEAADHKNRLYGEERLLRVLSRNKDATPEGTLEAVTEDIAAYVKDEPASDDITMMCFDFFGPDYKA